VDVIASVEALFIILAFVVPGFVMSVVRSQFATGRPQKGTEEVLGYLTLSAINYAVFSWLVYILVATVPRSRVLDPAAAVLPQAGLLCRTLRQPVRGSTVSKVLPT
jgi:hypothetical protein